jgi:phage repressor protein C with HTH and peptisase S24 domain
MEGLRDSGNLLIRRLRIGVGDRVRALADNPQHREFVADAGEIEIVGRVVWRGSLL